jgi:hypothetical protein
MRGRQGNWPESSLSETFRIWICSCFQHWIGKRPTATPQPDDTVIAGGNITKLDVLTQRCRQGANAMASSGGFRLWTEDSVIPAILPAARISSGE